MEFPVLLYSRVNQSVMEQGDRHGSHSGWALIPRGVSPQGDLKARFLAHLFLPGSSALTRGWQHSLG